MTDSTPFPSHRKPNIPAAQIPDQPEDEADLSRWLGKFGWGATPKDFEKYFPEGDTK